MIADDWKYEELRKSWQEYKVQNRVCSLITYIAFVSKSKGRYYYKKGGYKRRLRRNWKEVELIKYGNGSWVSWHRFPFDVVATEVYGDILNSEQTLMDEIRFNFRKCDENFRN